MESLGPNHRAGTVDPSSLYLVRERLGINEDRLAGGPQPRLWARATGGGREFSTASYGLNATQPDSRQSLPNDRLTLQDS